MRVFAAAAFRYSGVNYQAGWQDMADQSLVNTLNTALLVFLDQPVQSSAVQLSLLQSLGFSTAVGATVTATGTLPASALGSVTPYNSASAGVLTLPAAAAAWAASPYGLVIVSQKGAGAASFASTDTLRATSGIATSSVQYGMIAAQIISATEWALA